MTWAALERRARAPSALHAPVELAGGRAGAAADLSARMRPSSISIWRGGALRAVVVGDHDDLVPAA